jgi:uncharacterized protein YukE
MMAAPGNYNDGGMVISVNPDEMFRLATVDMLNHGQTVSDALNSIADIWNGLALGWVGDSASEAQDFNAKWSSAITALFGPPGDSPSNPSGALNQIANAVANAAVNYGEAEDANLKMFEQYGSGGSSTGATRNNTLGPVTESAPTPS